MGCHHSKVQVGRHAHIAKIVETRAVAPEELDYLGTPRLQPQPENERGEDRTQHLGKKNDLVWRTSFGLIQASVKMLILLFICLFISHIVVPIIMRKLQRYDIN